MLRELTSNFEQATEVSFHDPYTLAVAEYVAQIFDNRTKYVEMPNQTNPGEIETTNISRIHEPSTLQTSGTCSHPDACCEPSSVCLSCVEGGPAARADIAGAELCCSAGTSTWPGLTVPSSCIHVGNLTTKGWMAPRSSKVRQASWTRAHSASVFGRVLQERSGSNVDFSSRSSWGAVGSCPALAESSCWAVEVSAWLAGTGGMDGRQPGMTHHVTIPLGERTRVGGVQQQTGSGTWLTSDRAGRATLALRPRHSAAGLDGTTLA